VALGNSLDFFLTFQVKGSSGRSHEAVRHLQDHFRPGAAGTLGNSVALHAVALTQGDDFFPL
jgi:hypothetical protein